MIENDRNLNQATIVAQSWRKFALQIRRERRARTNSQNRHLLKKALTPLREGFWSR